MVDLVEVPCWLIWLRRDKCLVDFIVGCVVEILLVYLNVLCCKFSFCELLVALCCCSLPCSLWFVCFGIGCFLTADLFGCYCIALLCLCYVALFAFGIFFVVARFTTDLLGFTLFVGVCGFGLVWARLPFFCLFCIYGLFTNALWFWMCYFVALWSLFPLICFDLGLRNYG